MFFITHSKGQICNIYFLFRGNAIPDKGLYKRPWYLRCACKSYTKLNTYYRSDMKVGSGTPAYNFCVIAVPNLWSTQLNICVLF
jgi:hypothetical protein